MSHEIRHDLATAIGDVEYADSARDSRSDSPHLAVANINLFTMLKATMHGGVQRRATNNYPTGH